MPSAGAIYRAPTSSPIQVGIKITRAGLAWSPARVVEGAVTYFPTFAVSSAWSGLTSLFGMGRGGALTLWPPECLCPTASRGRGDVVKKS